jgi:hypothetical protein
MSLCLLEKNKYIQIFKNVCTYGFLSCRLDNRWSGLTNVRQLKSRKMHSPLCRTSRRFVSATLCCVLQSTLPIRQFFTMRAWWPIMSFNFSWSTVFFVDLLNSLSLVSTRVARLISVQKYRNGKKYTKWPQAIPNCHKIYQMDLKYCNWS